jgi:hypothetical protein
MRPWREVDDAFVSDQFRVFPAGLGMWFIVDKYDAGWITGPFQSSSQARRAANAAEDRRVSRTRAAS